MGRGIQGVLDGWVATTPVMLHDAVTPHQRTMAPVEWRCPDRTLSHGLLNQSVPPLDLEAPQPQTSVQL